MDKYSYEASDRLKDILAGPDLGSPQDIVFHPEMLQHVQKAAGEDILKMDRRMSRHKRAFDPDEARQELLEGWTPFISDYLHREPDADLASLLHNTLHWCESHLGHEQPEKPAKWVNEWLDLAAQVYEKLLAKGCSVRVILHPVGVDAEGEEVVVVTQKGAPLDIEATSFEISALADGIVDRFEDGASYVLYQVMPSPCFLDPDTRRYRRCAVARAAGPGFAKPDRSAYVSHEPRPNPDTPTWASQEVRAPMWSVTETFVLAQNSVQEALSDSERGLGAVTDIQARLWFLGTQKNAEALRDMLDGISDPRFSGVMMKGQDSLGDSELTVVEDVLDYVFEGTLDELFESIATGGDVVPCLNRAIMDSVTWQRELRDIPRAIGVYFQMLWCPVLFEPGYIGFETVYGFGKRQT